MAEVKCKKTSRAGRGRGYCAYKHSRDPEGWLRGSASLDTETGVVTLNFQIETDSVASAPRGRMSVRFYDADGVQLTAIKMNRSAYRGGKKPGKAERKTYKMKSKIPIPVARKVRSLKVKVWQTGKYTRIVDWKLKDFIKFLEDGIAIIALVI